MPVGAPDYAKYLGWTRQPVGCWPANADPIELYARANWEWGSWREVVPPNQIKTDFSLVGVHVKIAAKTYDYNIVVQIGVGPAGEEEPVCTLPFSWGYYSSAGAFLDGVNLWLPITRHIPANSRVAARCAWDYGAGALAGRVKILYIPHPL